MSWDPNTAVILYQPIDFYAIAAQEVSKSIAETKLAIEQIEKNLSAYAPKEQSQGLWFGRKITVVLSGVSGSDNAMNKDATANKIEKLQQIQLSIHSLSEEFNHSVKEFRTTLAAEILPIEEKVKHLNAICENHLGKYQEILSSQRKLY